MKHDLLTPVDDDERARWRDLGIVLDQPSPPSPPAPVLALRADHRGPPADQPMDVWGTIERVAKSVVRIYERLQQKADVSRIEALERRIAALEEKRRGR